MFRKLILFIFIGLMLLSSPIFGEDNPLGWKITKTQLDNGLKIIVLEDHSTPSAAFQIWYHVGSKNEQPGITGISHMTEHMMFKGSKNVGPEEHARIIQSKGGASNAFTSFDMTAYHEVLGADELETAMWLEADRMENLNIDSAELASEKQVVAEERRTSIDNSPFGPVFEQLLNSAFTASSYRWHVLGYMSDIEHYTHYKLRKHHDTYYKPNNATAIVVGDVKTDDAIKMVKKYFGKIKPGPEDLYRPITEEPKQMGERRSDIHKVAQLPAFFMGYKVVESGHPDSYALSVLGKILFDGESSRIYKRLVRDEELCVYTGGSFFEFESPGLFYIFAIMQNPGKKTEDAEAIVYEEVEKLKTTPIPENVLQKALNQIEADAWYQLQSNENKGYALGWYETIRGDYGLLFDDLEKSMQVTAEDVMRVANEYFDEKNRTVVTLVPDMTAGTMDIGY